MPLAPTHAAAMAAATSQFYEYQNAAAAAAAAAALSSYPSQYAAAAAAAASFDPYTSAAAGNYHSHNRESHFPRCKKSEIQKPNIPHIMITVHFLVKYTYITRAHVPCVISTEPVDNFGCSVVILRTATFIEEKFLISEKSRFYDVLLERRESRFDHGVRLIPFKQL